MNNFFINSEYCSECVCLGKTVGNGVPNALVGNGFCNDDTNNVECNYDGGDCCENVKTDYCSECNCYLQMSCATGNPPLSVGDGICNDESNIKDCMFDGLDCCGLDFHQDGYYDDYFDFDPITTLCTDCICQGMFIPFSTNGFFAFSLPSENWL